MSGEFIDSKVFLYLFDETDPRKRETAEGLVYAALETGTAAISFQVIQETLNVITRKLETPATPEDARRFMDQVLVPLWRIMPSQGALSPRPRYSGALPLRVLRRPDHRRRPRRGMQPALQRRPAAWPAHRGTIENPFEE
jgi:hypothetical protein